MSYNLSLEYLRKFNWKNNNDNMPAKVLKPAYWYKVELPVLDFLHRFQSRAYTIDSFIELL